MSGLLRFRHGGREECRYRGYHASGRLVCSIVNIRRARLVVSKSMVHRYCLECGGELVLAFQPAEKSWHSPGDATQAKSKRTWRCGTCGHEFDAEQLRGKVLKSAKVEQT